MAARVEIQEEKKNTQLVEHVCQIMKPTPIKHLEHLIQPRPVCVSFCFCFDSFKTTLHPPLPFYIPSMFTALENAL